MYLLYEKEVHEAIRSELELLLRWMEETRNLNPHATVEEIIEVAHEKVGSEKYVIVSGLNSKPKHAKVSTPKNSVDNATEIEAPFEEAAPAIIPVVATFDKNDTASNSEDLTETEKDSEPEENISSEEETDDELDELEGLINFEELDDLTELEDSSKETAEDFESSDNDSLLEATEEVTEETIEQPVEENPVVDNSTEEYAEVEDYEDDNEVELAVDEAIEEETVDVVSQKEAPAAAPTRTLPQRRPREEYLPVEDEDDDEYASVVNPEYVLEADNFPTGGNYDSDDETPDDGEEPEKEMTEEEQAEEDERVRLLNDPEYQAQRRNMIRANQTAIYGNPTDIEEL